MAWILHPREGWVGCGERLPAKPAARLRCPGRARRWRAAQLPAAAASCLVQSCPSCQPRPARSRSGHTACCGGCRAAQRLMRYLTRFTWHHRSLRGLQTSLPVGRHLAGETVVHPSAVPCNREPHVFFNNLHWYTRTVLPESHMFHQGQCRAAFAMRRMQVTSGRQAAAGVPGRRCIKNQVGARMAPLHLICP